MKLRLIQLVTIASFFLPSGLRAAEIDPALAQQGYDILKKYCYGCHGTTFAVQGFNVLDKDSLLADRGEGETSYLAGDPAQSLIWQRVGVTGEMPPSDSPQPSAEEKELLQRWIAAGGPFPERDERRFLDDVTILSAIRDSLSATAAEDRPFQRYFTLSHLHNHKNVTIDELRQSRAALSKVVNSLSWKESIVVPTPVDAEETVFGVDLRSLGWSAELWDEVLKVYPYGLKYDRHDDERMRVLATELDSLAASTLCFVRADWFVATATRPPLYHVFLGLPDNIKDLKKLVNVDTQADFLSNTLKRAGFATSAVSSQNRLVDRHHALYGSYWESYDFKSNEGTGNLFRFPLGPAFDKHPFPEQVFVHDGGEIVFNLPNGLNGYFLIDGKGKRIDVGPIEVVSDSLKTSGTPNIVNGLSCMACHVKGVVEFKDSIREGVAVFGAARTKVQELFTTQEKMDEAIKKDQTRFLTALEKAIGPFLQVGDDAGKRIQDFPEPVGSLARRYVKDLDPGEAGNELGIEDPRDFPAMIRGNRRLRELGLGPLGKGATIKRDVWSSAKAGSSLFQEAARELELGVPLRKL